MEYRQCGHAKGLGATTKKKVALTTNVREQTAASLGQPYHAPLQRQLFRHLFFQGERGGGVPSLGAMTAHRWTQRLFAWVKAGCHTPEA